MASATSRKAVFFRRLNILDISRVFLNELILLSLNIVNLVSYIPLLGLV
ncbi:MAG: hypothetical protein K2J65_10190 [Duncaniella sp.]|nr:hypothetical protein [Duncaniella sp.]